MNEGSFHQQEAMRYVQEGYEKQMQGLLHEAIDHYRKSIEIHPTPEAHTFLGWAYSFQNLYDHAIEECQKAIALDPEYGNPYNDIGAYLIETGKMDEAIPWLEKATTARRYESYCYPYYNLGRIWEKKGDWLRAIQCFEKAVSDNPEYLLAKHALLKLQGLMN
ncbi:MAG: tetratricopeptide repeat protein [Candidatus Omnitrophica bacterium]|nr:tetratricopeptide repeat protein [Candidatus Omnitrophota bacterium]